jgi:MFS family permease
VFLTTSNSAVDSATALEKPKKVAAVIVTGHGFQHMYADGFLILLDPIYQAFGLNPLSAGLLSTVRQAAGGLFTIGGGFVVDMFSGMRGILLAGSLFAMGFGYALAAAAPNYALLLVALAIGSGAGSFWHPVGLGILSTSFPERRALMMALHRSAGSIGEVASAVAIGAALFLLTWREVLWAMFALMTAVAIIIYVMLSKLGLQSKATEKRNAGEQFRSIGQLFRDRTLPMLLLVSGLRGMADRGFVFFLPLFIGQAVRLEDPAASGAYVTGVIAYNFAVMSVMAIIFPPFIGMVADIVGRKPIMIIGLIGASAVTFILMFFTELGFVFTGLLAVLGAFRFAFANIAQAASLDIAEGKRLEGSMIGLLWGNNATWGALSPAILGGIIAIWGTGDNSFVFVFPYAVVLTVASTVAAFFLPNTGKRANRKQPAA